MERDPRTGLAPGGAGGAATAVRGAEQKATDEPRRRTVDEPGTGPASQAATGERGSGGLPSRGGLFLFSALIAGNGSSYLFHLIMTRLLGPSDYGALGALLGILLVLGVPVAAIQAVVARRAAVEGDARALGGVVRPALRLAGAGGLGAAVAIAALAHWGASFLRMSSPVPVLVLAALVVPSVVAPVGRGALQGRSRFMVLGGAIVLHALLRLGLAVLFVALGLGLTGALLGLVAAELAGVGFVFLPLRGELRGGLRGAPEAHGLAREGLGATLSLLAFWVLASVDVVLVRHYFPAEASGQYAGAALVGKAVLFAATALAMVAYPHFADASEERGAERLLRLAVGVTVGFAVTTAVLVTLLPEALTVTLGDAYRPAAELAPVLAFAGGGFGVAAILTYRQLAAGRGRLPTLWVAIPVEILTLALVHPSPRVVAGIALGTSCLVAANLWARRPRSHPLRRVPQGELWRELESVDLSVVTPTYNGEEFIRTSLSSLISVLRTAGVRYEVIVVSDGSTDGTTRAAKAFEADGVRLLAYDENRGKGHALRTGLARASGRYVAFIDSDGDLDPADLVRFLTLMRLYDADMVTGCKRHPLSDVSYPLSRRLLSWAYHKLVQFLFGIKVRDTQAGIKLIRRDVLAEVLPRLLEKRFALDLELMVAARRAGHGRILEAPIKVRYRFASTISRRAIIGMARDTLAIWYRRYLVRQYDPPARWHEQPVAGLLLGAAPRAAGE